LKPNFRILNFSAPARVREGERFSIVLRSDGQYVSANGPVGNPYFGGIGFFDSRPNPPGVWAPLAVGTERHDLPFQTFVSPGADHLKCYDAVSDKQKPREVMLEDRYGGGKAFPGDVVRLCVPVDKNDEGVENPGQVLTCYQVVRDRSNPEKRRVKVRNQFGAISVTTKPSSILCVPSAVAGPSR
jgi:hypothetical protein